VLSTCAYKKCGKQMGDRNFEILGFWDFGIYQKVQTGANLKISKSQNQKLPLEIQE
jgi:hypothetical protein